MLCSIQGSAILLTCAQCSVNADWPFQGYPTNFEQGDWAHGIEVSHTVPGLQCDVALLICEYWREVKLWITLLYDLEMVF